MRSLLRLQTSCLLHLQTRHLLCLQAQTQQITKCESKPLVEAAFRYSHLQTLEWSSHAHPHDKSTPSAICAKVLLN